MVCSSSLAGIESLSSMDVDARTAETARASIVGSSDEERRVERFPDDSTVEEAEAPTEDSERRNLIKR